MRYLPPNPTAGFAVFCVSAYKREPRPLQARIIATISFAIALFSPFTHFRIYWIWKWFDCVVRMRPGHSSVLAAFWRGACGQAFRLPQGSFQRARLWVCGPAWRVLLRVRQRFLPWASGRALAGAFSGAGSASAFALRVEVFLGFSSFTAGSTFSALALAVFVVLAAVFWQRSFSRSGPSWPDLLPCGCAWWAPQNTGCSWAAG